MFVARPKSNGVIKTAVTAAFSLQNKQFQFFLKKNNECMLMPSFLRSLTFEEPPWNESHCMRS